MGAPHFDSMADFEKNVLKSDKPVVVDFYAEWCGPCQMAAPIVDKLAEEYSDKVVIGKVDIDRVRDIAEKYSVMSIPTMIVFNNGEEVDRKVGFPGESGLRKMVQDLAN